MKKVFLFVVFTLTLCFMACGNHSEKAAEKAAPDSTKIDTLALVMQRLDSINNSGLLRHMDVYEIGKIKTIAIQTIRLSSQNDTVDYINLRKDCGGEYYYNWVNSTLFYDEVKYLTNSIDVILANIDREPSHEERYFYITKDNIRVFASNKGGKEWYTELSVNYQKDNSSVKMAKEDIEKLKELLKKAQSKIDEIQK